MTDVLALAAYAEDRWLDAGGGEALVSAVDGQVIAEMPTFGDSEAMLAHARKTGTAMLHKMTLRERGKLLRAMAEALDARKKELYELSYETGATRSDSAFDIEGGIGTLFYYSSMAKDLPDTYLLPDGPRTALSNGDFAGQHFLSPLRGAAVHINAYNFPVWGMLEKLAPTLLAGMPAIVKPASVGAYLTYSAFRIVIDNGIIPAGALQLLLGRPGDMIDQLDGQDVLAFTGSAQTAASLKTSSSIVTRAVRFTAEQDSLNASVLGPDASPGDPEFQLFVNEVVREMTQKAGQKCTAIRRALVPSALIDPVQDAITETLARISIGNPRAEGVRMGALAGLRQRENVRTNLDLLKRDTAVVFGGETPQLIDADAKRGAFVTPTLLRCDRPHESENVHAIEAFGPVSTLMPYVDIADAAAIARAGLGSLVCSLFTADANAIGEFVPAVASSHGRILIVDRDSAANSTGHGAAMPQLVHGGPGRAGGGEELGGLFGMERYMQRTAIQAPTERLEALASL